jgi:hypothetical protein
MKGPFLLIFLAVASSPTLAQIQHGTIGVVYYTKDKIIVAADSRVLPSFVNASPDDNECKVTTPYGKLVFVSSGAAAYHNGGVAGSVQSWSNIEEIHRAYSTTSLLYSTNYDRIMGTAESIASNWQSLLLEHPDVVIDAARMGNGILTRAIMGGFDNDGTLVIGEVAVSYQEGLSTIQFSTNGLSCPKIDLRSWKNRDRRGIC